MKIGYARVSTLDQNYEAQIEALKAAGCKKIFSENASGKNKKRPELEKLISQLRPDDVVIVTKLDRLARSLRDLVSIMNEFRELEVGFISLGENFDLSTPAGRMQMNMVGVFAEFEREMIVQRTKEGLAHAKANGRVGGRPPALSPTTEKAAMRAMEVDGLKANEAAKEFGVSRATIMRAWKRHKDNI